MSVLIDRVQGGKGWPSVDDDLVRNCLTELDPYKSMGSDLLHPRVLRRETGIAMARLLSLTFEVSWRSGRSLKTRKKQMLHQSF